jgi:hypothetical protein
MAGKEDNRMNCSEFDALLSQAIDGTLGGEKLTAFESHARACPTCGPMLQEAEAGRTWLKSLEEVQSPSALVTNILLRTTGLESTRMRGMSPAPASWTDRLRDLGSNILAPVFAVARQPRFAMSFGMAFFTLSVTLSLAGVKLSDMRHVDLRPSAIRRTYYETTGRVVKYYENIRFVYEIESRVREFKQATAPAEPAATQPEENRKEKEKDKDKDKNNSSGQPQPRQERNYSREGNQPVFASLPISDPPVVSEATYRRLS